METVAEASSLRVKYTSTVNGLRVVGFTKDGPIAFAKAAKLNKGDLILRIGQRTCSGDAPLDRLVEAACKDNNREVLVYVAKTRKVETYLLATSAASDTKDVKSEGSGSKPAPN